MVYQGVQQLDMTTYSPRIPRQCVKETVQCKSSKGEYVTLNQGAHVRYVAKKHLSKDHPFIEKEDYDERVYACCLSYYGMVLVPLRALYMDA